jgi:Na+/H+ antiporter NhaD/arsenite permease-like protein
LDLTTHWTGILSLFTFGVAYLVAISEERLQVRKSVPLLVAAGIIWALVGIGAAQSGAGATVAAAAEDTLLDYAELLLFLIPAMTYVNTLDDRGLFDALRIWLIQRGLSFRALFWATGGLAFVMSPITDNLTTGLLLGTVVLAVGRESPRFVALGCINVVVAANAGGTFSPFGDITTLMVWQAGKVEFREFFALAAPALVNWLVPAIILSFAIRDDRPSPPRQRAVLAPGAFPVLALLFVTIAITVVAHAALNLPPAVGMMAGLGLLKSFSYVNNLRVGATEALEVAATDVEAPELVQSKRLDVFDLLARIEWDTLMFFYGALMCVGGLGALGYLAAASQALYGGMDATRANILLGLLSAVIDNVPVMFAVLRMSPSMSDGQWLLVTLTTGVGGSLLSIGSAAGVALMGQARGMYTFGAHLRWAWAVALGFAASIGVHLVLNAALF